MEEALLVYAPFWVVTGRETGFFAGAEPEWVDRQVFSVHPAYDVSELTVPDIWLTGDEVVPLDLNRSRSEV